MELEDFVDQLIAEKGLDSEDPEIKAQIKEDLLDRVETRLNALILSNLPEEDLEEFEKVLDAGSDEQTQEFIRAHVADFDDKAAAELLTFKAMYLG